MAESWMSLPCLQKLSAEVAKGTRELTADIRKSNIPIGSPLIPDNACLAGKCLLSFGYSKNVWIMQHPSPPHPAPIMTMITYNVMSTDLPTSAP